MQQETEVFNSNKNDTFNKSKIFIINGKKEN
jgi:hypothetical protein